MTYLQAIVIGLLQGVLSHQIAAALAEPVALDGTEVRVTVSQGVVLAGPGDDAGSSSAHVLYAPTSGGEGGLRVTISFEAARQIWGWATGDPSDVTPFIGNGLSAWYQQNFLAKKNGLDLHAQFLISGINDIYLTGALRGYDTTLIRTRAERARFDWDFDRIVARAKSAAVIHMSNSSRPSSRWREVA